MSSAFTSVGTISSEAGALADKLPAGLVAHWDVHGTGYFGDGFLRVVDPIVTGQKLAGVADDVDLWIPVMTTGLGDVIYILQKKYVFATFYRYGYMDMISRDADAFVEQAPTMALQEGLLRKQPYPAAAARQGIPTLDQCYAYVPMLALGGPEKAENLDLSDMWIHLQIMRQLVGPPRDVWVSE